MSRRFFSEPLCILLGNKSDRYSLNFLGHSVLIQEPKTNCFWICKLFRLNCHRYEQIKNYGLGSFSLCLFQIQLPLHSQFAFSTIFQKCFISLVLPLKDFSLDLLQPQNQVMLKVHPWFTSSPFAVLFSR